jgi:phosphoribosylpyrophosphate synthetase
MQKAPTAKLSTGELVVNFDGECKGKDFDLHSTSPRADAILEIAFVSHLIKSLGGNLRTLFCKYFPYARFEREAIWMANFIANLGFKEVIITEARNKLALEIWLSKAIFLPMINFFTEQARGKVIISPDEPEAIARAADLNAAINAETQHFTPDCLDQDQIEGKDCFLIYDILDDTTHEKIFDALISLKTVKCGKITLAVAHYVPYQQIEALKYICSEILYLNAVNVVTKLGEEGQDAH